MKISNFILSKWGKEKKIIYGVEFIPNKTLNKTTDNMSVVLIKTLDKSLHYKVLFKKNKSLNVINNEFYFSIKRFKGYINFLSKFMKLMYKEYHKNIRKQFFINYKNKIVVSSLNNKYIKICALKKNKSVFFILSIEELNSYIESLKEIYLMKAIVKYLNYKNNNTDVNLLSKEDKNNLYEETLKILIDDALDRKDKIAFTLLSKELYSICT
ncbi:hypothetical protein CLOACE_22510 [Clostridium acetireducens DSM 10703]|uniref:IDEAL domain-containing protein n=1 Tax=Clostridium acetireducens DSM 10703 TaxID=1121290 RepID=A0A1E8EV38_9CLOT|nr:IDEAL domain-containing protein [Clostridium acetireducens]OFH99381.1 hypothetical protein CLOACE_22510 [Clostridium acetireducens DSM 10703]